MASRALPLRVSLCTTWHHNEGGRNGKGTERLACVQLMEDLEQLKVIENGYKIKVIIVDHCAHGVDEPADVDSIISKMRDMGQH